MVLLPYYYVSVNKVYIYIMFEKIVSTIRAFNTQCKLGFAHLRTDWTQCEAKFQIQEQLEN